MPVFMFMPSHVPVDFVSLPAIMLASYAKGPILFVLRPACSSLLKAIINLILFFFPSFILPAFYLLSFYFSSFLFYPFSFYSFY